MEIKCVKKEKIEYPKINEISNKKLKTYIPNKWIKLGVTSFLFNILMQSKSFADISVSAGLVEQTVAGDLPTPSSYKYVMAGCNIILLISVLTCIISAVVIIIKKSKAKKQGESIKVSKKIKIVFIISIILLVLSRIGCLIANYLK